MTDKIKTPAGCESAQGKCCNCSNLTVHNTNGGIFNQDFLKMIHGVTLKAFRVFMDKGLYQSPNYHGILVAELIRAYLDEQDRRNGGQHDSL